MKILDGGRISIAALALGIARGAYEAALEYSKRARQFGQPICEFQAIQFYLADMATEIDAARLLTERAARPKDRGTKVTQALRPGEALRLRDRGPRRPTARVQIHGGYGFIKDFPVEKFYRDVKLCTIGEGTTRDPAAGHRPAAPQGMTFHVPLETRVLSNGLTVVVSENPAAPVFGLCVLYRIGSRLEPRGVPASRTSSST